jgi:hypothetical protein
MFPSLHLTRARRRASCALALAAAGVLAPRTAGADEVLRWNRIATTVAAHHPLDPLAEARLFAVLHTAIHDAVTAIDRRHEPYCAVTLDAAGALPEAAVASAAHVVLTTWLQTERPALDAALADSLAALPEGRARDIGVASGRQAADLVMASWAGAAPTDVTEHTAAGRGGCRRARWDAIGNTRSEVIELLSHGCDSDHVSLYESPEVVSPETRVQEWNRRARLLSASRALDLVGNARLFAVINRLIHDGPRDGLD